MADPYDLIVIGSGAAGQTVAGACVEAGWSVAVVDDRPFGGTCAQRGCDPKKVLVHATHVLDQAEQRRGTGLEGDLHVDWPALMDFKKTFTDPVPEQIEGWFETAGIDAIRGTARFSGEQEITVESDGEPESYGFEQCVIACGTKPTPLPIPGAEHLHHSDDLLAWGTLPERIVFVGGGYISSEFAHLVARAGAKAVHVLQRGPRILEGFDADLVSTLTEATRALGINVHTGHDVTCIEKHGDDYCVTAQSGGQEVRFWADAVVHGAGRVPPLDDLHLDAAGIERDGKALALNEYLQSPSNPAVYACGDVATASKALTPTATIEGQAVAHNLLNGNEKTPALEVVPTVAFTSPRLASVGYTPDEADAAGVEYEVHQSDASSWYTARMRGSEYAHYKILVDPSSDQVLGAHLIYPHAEDVINTFALAIRHGLPASELADFPYAYPTSHWDARYMLG